MQEINKQINISYFAIPGIAVRKLYKAEAIIKAVCDYFETSPDYLKCKSRHMDVVLPRHIAMYLIRKKTPYTCLNIGKYFYRDHTTVLNACKQVENYFATKNWHVITAVEAISDKLRVGNS